MKKALYGVLAIVGLVGLIGVASPTPTYAADPLADICADNPDSTVCDTSNTTEPESVLKIVVNTLLMITGAASVVMIIVGGLRYVVSAGNSAAVTGAKNTIIYAIVGLVVSFMAFAVVNWVLTEI